MSENTNLKAAQSTFETLCRSLDKNGWHYEKFDEEFKIECGAQGEDLPIELSIYVDPERMVILLLSRLPFAIPEDKRVDIAIAISVINNRIVDGSFDYDIKSGNTVFRLTNSCMESLIGEELFIHMVMVACYTIDAYNDKLLMLSKGMLSLDKFIEENT